jgi:hypothetical protein
MSKTAIFPVLALAALALVPAAANAGSMPTAITFDGYCDGVTNVMVMGNSKIATATHAYENCGGYSDTPMVGPESQKLKGGKIGFAATDGSYAEFGLTFVYIIKSDHTWNLLSAETGGALNSGTWSEGYADSGARGGVPSFTPAR